jgi:hypothetical protein
MDVGMSGPMCMSRIPPLAKPKLHVNANGYPDVMSHERCGQIVGVTSWPGRHGQMLVACSLPLHRADVEAQDAPYRPDPDFAHRIRHEMEEATREELSR